MLIIIVNNNKADLNNLAPSCSLKTSLTNLIRFNKVIPVAALARAKYIITSQARLSAGLYTSPLLQNSSIVKPIGNIQKNEHNRKEQPGEKLHGVEDFDIVVHFLGFR